MRCASIWFTVSSATPTTIIRLVPPNWNGTRNALRDHRRHDADGGDVDRAGRREAREHAIDVLGRLLAGTNARDVRLLLLQVLRHVDRLERDGRVEEREEDDEQREQRVEDPVAAVQVRAERLHAGMLKLASVAGNISKLEAKIGGIMLAMFTLSGRCARCPPYTRRPT